MTNADKYPHYFKRVPTNEIDVYSVLRAFEVTDPCLQHAIKKLLVPGKRGSKDRDTDVAQAMDALRRYQQMSQESADYERNRHGVSAGLAIAANGHAGTEPVREHASGSATEVADGERVGELGGSGTRTCCGAYINSCSPVCNGCPKLG